MSHQREQAEPLGLGLKGPRIELVDASRGTEGEVRRFREQSRLVAAMGTGLKSASSPYAPPMLIRSLRDGRVVGLIENEALPGGVAVLVVYVEPGARPGFGIEAVALYVSALFDAGARLVSADVLSFNQAVIGIMAKSGWEPQARLREHVYAAGHLWDVLVYSFDRESWTRALRRYVRRSAGGDRWPAFFGRAGEGEPAG